MVDETTGAETIARARQALSAGDFIAVVDVLARERDRLDATNTIEATYLGVLALARLGSFEQAKQRYKDALASVPLDTLPPKLGRDILALNARLLKDEALAATTKAARTQGFVAAANAYRQVYERFGGYYPLVNVATLLRCAGRTAAAREVAAAALTEIEEALKVASPEDLYWSLASKGETLLVLGEIDGAREVFGRAAKAAGGAHSDIASVKRNLAILCHAASIPEDVHAGLRAPSIMHYWSEHRADAGPAPASNESVSRKIADETRTFVAERGIGFAYGGLTPGPELLIAEACVAAGVELNAVLPFPPADFARLVVAPMGGDWLRRFEACVSRAASITSVVEHGYSADERLFRAASLYGMGLARSRASILMTDAHQLTASYDGEPTSRAGKAPALWRKLGLPSATIGIGRARKGRRARTRAKSAPGAALQLRSFLFADTLGFSRMNEPQLKVFASNVFGALARVIDRYGPACEYRETAGDGMFLIFNDQEAAADCALHLQEKLSTLNLAALGLPADLKLRMAIHYGPASPVFDAILRKRKFVGREIIKAARMEPVTPPGQVFITEQMAAALALHGSKRFSFEYAGNVPLAKNFGAFRMYGLRARTLD